MRALAITGMLTLCWISWILVGSAMRATPPWARMSEGTRSRAITAHGTGIFGDLGLFGVGDVHDDAAFEHVGEAAFHTHGADISHGNLR